MDLATLEAHRTWWGKAGNVADTYPDTLTHEEKALYLRVRAESIQLEQERVLQSWVEARCSSLRQQVSDGQ